MTVHIEPRKDVNMDEIIAVPRGPAPVVPTPFTNASTES